MSELTELLYKSIEQLDNWLSCNGWAGYDPYDLKGIPLFIKDNPNIFEKVIRKTAIKAESFVPLLLRRIFRVNKTINAKAMGLFADGYLNLYQATRKRSYLEKAEEAIQWLDENYSVGYSGSCWGYPFDWQSRIFIPAGTPSSVVSATVGSAYWNFYEITNEEKYLKTCTSICNFFVQDLNVDQIDKNKLCFSYTPLDSFHVHNANLFVAEFLIRVGKEIGKEQFIDLGLKAVNYALSEQNEDGSLCYWGKDQDSQCHIDHYHSGFEIRCLYSIWKYTKEERIHRAVDRYYRFYLTNLFEDNTIPKLTPQRKYPVNIHACAEALLCNTTLSPDFPEAIDYLANTARWVIKIMQDETGYFYYMIRELKGIKWKVKIPYIRWGQSWMLKAFSELLKEK
jgi:rhamnogalacturonyl hydrolase YesR